MTSCELFWFQLAVYVLSWFINPQQLSALRTRQTRGGQVQLSLLSCVPTQVGRPGTVHATPPYRAWSCVDLHFLSWQCLWGGSTAKLRVQAPVGEDEGATGPGMPSRLPGAAPARTSP